MRYSKLLVVGLLVGSACGCTTLLGNDFEIAGSAGSAGESSGGAAGTAPCLSGNCGSCSQDQVRCDGAAFQRCSSGGTWETVRTCASANLCDATGGGCREPTCEPGVLRCDGVELQRCAVDGSEWTLVASCQSPAHCSTRTERCTDEPCAAGAVQCSGNELTTCSTDQSGWTVTDVCDSSEFCNAEEMRCELPPCQPSEAGTHRCSGRLLQRCDAQSFGWVTEVTCATSALCDERDARCLEPACDVDDFQCVGAQLQRCNAGRDGFAPGPTCESATLCDAAHGQCDVCTPSQYSCAGAELRLCTSDGQDLALVSTCANSESCDAANAQCATCPTTGRGPAMVQLPGFCIDRTEVTNAQYKAFLDDAPPIDSQPSRCAWNTDFVPFTVAPPEDANKPVAYVDWCDAYAFCAWAGKRLCGKIGGGPNAMDDYTDMSRSQWYAACTSRVQGRVHTYGNTYEALTCNGFEGTELANVGSFAGCHSPNQPYSSVFDLNGNADEWEDSCELDIEDGSTDLCRTRGGAVRDGIEYQKCSSDYYDERSFYAHWLGFRCCAP